MKFGLCSEPSWQEVAVGLEWKHISRGSAQLSLVMLHGSRQMSTLVCGLILSRILLCGRIL